MRAWLFFLSVAGAALITACGGSSTAATQKQVGRYGPRNSPYAVSKCMRANGLSHFPDPSQGSGGVGFPGGLMIAGTGQLVVDGVNFGGPALKRAEQACKTYLPGGGGPPPTLSAGATRAAIKMAHCMRANGVPNFPDPESGRPGGGGAANQVPLPDPNSPAFKHAVSVCGRNGGFSFHAGG